ncbi:hypothetical protein [Trabulsiella odontotermitis]|uniref:Uncharacterized protein n=1 Tax=Trabulsiella odontotermitis TaxID=379893 RepID=A0A0L0GWW7_9ENTR|nr:hypothetical protein [Trabulsiella odontotermitis]KNC93269.1 hypothetical protein GM31_20155 [Trabulsiella odontotermitis]
MTGSACQRGLILAVIALLSGCATGRTSPAPAVSVTLLEALSGQVTGLQSRAAQGDRQAEADVISMLSGHGVEVLMAQRNKPENPDSTPVPVPSAKAHSR